MTRTDLLLCAAQHRLVARDLRADARRFDQEKRRAEARVARLCARTQARWARELTAYAARPAPLRHA